MAKIYVKKTGNDTTGNGTDATPYLTINKAYSVAINGDEILVGAGTYQEYLRLEKGVSIRPMDGLTANDVILDGNNYTLPNFEDRAGGTLNGNTYYAFTYKGLIDIWASNVSVKNITIQYSKGRGVNIYSQGGNASRNNNVTVEGVIIQHCRHAAGVTQYVNNVTIKDCSSDDTGNYAPFNRSPHDLNWPQAFSVKQGTTILFENNYIKNHWGEGVGVTQDLEDFIIRNNIVENTFNTPIYIQRCNGGVVERNLIYSPNTLGGATNPGIQINSETSEGGNSSATFDTGNVIVRNNVIIGMLRGISQMAGAGGTFKFENFIIENNTLINSIERGIHVAGNAVLTNYVIRNNTIYQGPGSGSLTNYNGGKDITWYNNAWSATPNVAAQGTGDITIDAADLVAPNDDISDDIVDINNYYPAVGSDLIDAAGATTVDYDYFNKLKNGTRDIGAIEYNGITSPGGGGGDANCPNNILTNGDFTTDISGWSTSGTDISASYDAGTVEIVVTSNVGTQQFYQNNLNIVSGQQYKLAFTVTGPNGAEIRPDLIDDASSVINLGFGPVNEILDGTEETFTYTFTANANSQNGRLRFRFQNGTGTFNLDNICFIEAVLAVDFQYSAPQSPIYVGDLVNFTSLITNSAPIVSYLWDFGDGTTETTEDATHTFNTDGVKTVSLTIEDSDGNIESVVKEINIAPLLGEDSTLVIGKGFITAFIVTTN